MSGEFEIPILGAKLNSFNWAGRRISALKGRRDLQKNLLSGKFQNAQLVALSAKLKLVYLSLLHIYGVEWLIPIAGSHSDAIGDSWTSPFVMLKSLSERARLPTSSGSLKCS